MWWGLWKVITRRVCSLTGCKEKQETTKHRSRRRALKMKALPEFSRGGREGTAGEDVLNFRGRILVWSGQNSCNIKKKNHTTEGEGREIYTCGEKGFCHYARGHTKGAKLQKE